MTLVGAGAGAGAEDDTLVRVRWVWVVLAVAVCAGTVVTAALVTYRPVANGQWGSISGTTGSVVVSGLGGAQPGALVDVAVPGDVVVATVTAVRPASQGSSPELDLELAGPVAVAAGDPVSVRFEATSVLSGLVSR